MGDVQTMRRQLLTIFATLVIGNVFALVIGVQMTPPLEHHTWIAQRKDEQMQARSATCTDVAVIGSSVGLMGVEPERLAQRLGGDVTAYNAALGGSYLTLDVDWFERFVEPRLRPALVLHVVAFPSVSTDRDGAHELSASWDAARASAGGLMDSVDRGVSTIMPIMRYRERLRDPAEWYALLGGELPEDRKPDEQLQLITATGFMVRDQVGDPAKLDEYRDIASRVLRDRGEPIQQEQLQALADHVLRRRAEGTEVVIVLSPTLDAIRSSIANDPDDFELYRATMRSLSNDVDAHLIDASDLAIPMTDFWDGLHVNLDGAFAFTDYVADELITRGVDPSCG